MHSSNWGPGSFVVALLGAVFLIGAIAYMLGGHTSMTAGGPVAPRTTTGSGPSITP
jgi:hypothetical protein